MVHGKIHTEDESMLLFHKGQRITEEQPIVFGDRNIIHVVDYAHVDKQEINIFIKLLEGSRK
jgi:hypothetical protein